MVNINTDHLSWRKHLTSWGNQIWYGTWRILEIIQSTRLVQFIIIIIIKIFFLLCYYS